MPIHTAEGLSSSGEGLEKTWPFKKKAKQKNQRKYIFRPALETDLAPAQQVAEGLSLGKEGIRLALVQSELSAEI